MKDEPATPLDRQLRNLMLGNAPVSLEQLDSLLAAGANPSVVGAGRSRPLHGAIRRGALPLVERLLAAGVDVNAEVWGARPLQLAVPAWRTQAGALSAEDEAAALQLFDRLVAADARLRPDTPLGDFLHAPLPFLERLLALGARADAPDDEARLAIHRAVLPVHVALVPITHSRPRLEVLRFLLARGAALDVADGQGRTPLVLAEEHLAAGAEIAGHTPETAAAARADAEEVLALLRAAGAPRAASGPRTPRPHGPRLEELGRPTSFDELSARHAGATWLPWLRETPSLIDLPISPVLVEGGLRHVGDLETGEGPWVVVVDGDLELDGDLHLSTGDYRCSMLLVTGSLRCRNLSYSGSARVGVERDLHASGLVLGSNGDSNACLGAAGSLTARAVLLDDHTSISAGTFHTLIVGAPGWQEFRPDLRDDFEQNATHFHPDVLYEGSLDHDLALARARTGAGPFLPEVERALREKKQLPPTD